MDSPKKSPRTNTSRGRHILCVTDFSPEATQADEAAAAMAQKLGEPLFLVHAIEITHLGEISHVAADQPADR